ncbi:hypothetical protein BC833DRAFT_581470 [Globomyces pollinis-pini]|nr:hypothetical protein BC833DRAFT_581470 [Globomyces pollinis-pini]KAJ2999709.1 hypothetical protein HDV02_001952 [Globomyces sp. JEL0801]
MVQPNTYSSITNLLNNDDSALAWLSDVIDSNIMDTLDDLMPVSTLMSFSQSTARTSSIPQINLDLQRRAQKLLKLERDRMATFLAYSLTIAEIKVKFSKDPASIERMDRYQKKRDALFICLPPKKQLLFTSPNKAEVCIIPFPQKQRRKSLMTVCARDEIRQLSR